MIKNLTRRLSINFSQENPTSQNPNQFKNHLNRRSIRKTPHIKESIGFLFLLRERHFRSALFSPSPPSSLPSSHPCVQVVIVSVSQFETD